MPYCSDPHCDHCNPPKNPTYRQLERKVDILIELLALERITRAIKQEDSDDYPQYEMINWFNNTNKDHSDINKEVLEKIKYIEGCY
jgi:hypothetical protein